MKLEPYSLELLNNPVSTNCDHPFCRFCILEFLEKKRSVPCPLCKAPITKRSLNERPQLNSMVEGVRSLIQAFQEDTGAIFSPPRGLPSMNLTPCTPEPLPCKAARGTKRKIIVESPKRTVNKQNCRQSKRRKSLKIPENEKTIAETSSKILAIEDQCDLLKYLDQGSCGAESGHSEERTKNLETSANQLNYELRKNNVIIVKQNVLPEDITELKNVITKCETLNSCVDTSKTKEVDLVYEKQKVPRGYSLRSPSRVNYNVDSQGKDSFSPTSKSDLYNFNNSPVTPVHLLRHHRDNLQVKQGSQLRMEYKGFKHVKSTNNILNDTHIRTERVEARKGKELTIGNNTIDSTLSVQKNSQTDASQDQASPDFQPKERQLFADKTYRRQKNNANADKTYKRQRNKTSDTQIYSKVNSWLIDNPVSQNSSDREVSLLHGMVENINVPIEIQEDVDEQNPVLEVLNEKENDKKNSLKGYKENFSEENFSEVKGTSVITSEDGINRIDTIETDAVDFNNLGIRPLASQKRRIFKSKPTTQTTSVCQKKGVLVIKKVSPTGNTASKSTHQNNVSVEKEAVIDPFEFKSSQKTPVIPESKKIKHVKKQQKDRMKGKLDFMSGNTTNMKQKESIKISDDQQIHTENTVKITIETNSADKGSLMEDTEKHNGRKQSDILPENTTLVQNAKVINSLNSDKTDTDSELNIIPGSLDDSTHLGKSKKGRRLSNKLKKKKQEEETNKKNIKKLIETINSAEDEDLLTCTQEVLQQMDWREDSNKPSSEDIIPDTANMQISFKTRKFVSFASNNIEISGTPRQTRRSVPMVVDKNKGRLLPKETRGKNVQNGRQNLATSSQVQVIKQKKQEIMAEKTKKPFVWEEKDNDSDGSTSTEDLDIHPSQEEFELPSHDVQSQETRRIIENKKDPIRVIPEPQKDPTQGIPEPQKDPTQGIPEPQKDPTQGIPEPQKDPTQVIPGLQKDPTQVIPGLQKDPTQGIPESQKDPTQGIPEPQKDPTQGIPEPQKDAVVDECRCGQIESQNLSKDTKVRKNEHLSPNRSQLVENLSENADESVPINNSNIYVENTQENVDGMQLENEMETMDVQVIPESVDDIIMEAKLVPEPTEMLPPSQNQSSQNYGIHSEDQKLNYEKVLTKQKQKKNMYQSLNVTENNESPEISSQSTVSTVNKIIDSDVPVRKSRSKLRSRKVKSQDSIASNCPREIQSVVEKTPVSNNCQSQLKNMDTLSDTTSQQSVSILLPPGKGDNLNPTGNSETRIAEGGETVDQANIKNHMIKKTEINSYSDEIDIGNSVEMIPATESDSMLSLSDHTIKSGKHLSQSSTLASQKRRIRNSKEKSGKMQEIFPDSDVEIISQPYIPGHLMGTPIVLSGTQTYNEETLEVKFSLEKKTAEKNYSNNGEKVLMTVDSERDSTPSECEHVVHQNKSEDKVKGKESQQGYLNLDTDDTLPPTLVSQKSLNIRNSAEKKRRSEERQLACQETEEGRTAKTKLETTESCSPEDIFMMDSEIQSNYSQSLPQNQEGLICLDLEPSEVLNSNLIVERASQKSLLKKNQGTQETENINKTGQFEDKIVVKPLEKIDKKENDLLTPPPESLQNISYIDKESIKQGNKSQNHLSDPDKDILSPEKVKTCKGKRTVRGLARKRKSLNQQNNTISESASEDLDKQKDLNESNNEISDRIKDQTLTSKRLCSSPKKLETTSPYRNVIKSPFSSHTDMKYTELTPTKKETMTAQENIPKAQKISPTFTFSPKKPKKAKAVKLNVGTERLSQKTELQGQNIENVEDNDTDVIVHVKLNNFERLLRDNIADTEMSEEEDEIIRQDKLNFSDDLTLMEDDIGDKSKTFTLDLKNQKYLSRKNKPFKNQQTSSLLPEIDNIPDSSTPLTRTKISNQVKLNRSGQNFKMKKYEERKTVRDSHHVDNDVDIEASSPLPDIIGKDQYNDNHQDFSSDSEDAVLIKSCHTVHVFDGESKQSKPFSDIEVKDKLDLDDVLEVDTVEPPDEDQMSDDDVEVVRVKKKRRRIVEDDSDSSNASEDSVTSRHLNNTSSSAFSSQSEPINSQQRNKLESDLERMRREMQEIEAQLAADNATNSTRIEREDASTENTNKLNFSDIGEPNERPDSRNSDVIQEYQSDEELFLSPHPPSPPPLSPQQIEIIEETDFTSEFRRHGLELLPVESSHEKKKRSKVEIEVGEDKELTSPRRSTRSDIDQKHLSVIDQVNNENIPSQIKSSPWKNQLAQIARDNITPKPSKLLYSPLDQRSPQLSPAMERKRQKILSPLVTNTVETKRLQRCFVSTGLVLPQMKELQKLAVLNQCQFCTKFSKDVTHVIVKTEPIGSRVCDRTLKFFKGISQGCWILDYEWVVDSRAAGNLLPEADYEIKGDTVTDDFHFGPMKSRQSTTGPLFDDIQFLVLGDSKGLQKDDLKSLLLSCGGQVKCNIEDITDQQHSLVITCSDYDNDSDDEDSPSPDELKLFKEFYVHHGLLSVSREWALDSLTVYNLQPVTDYILTPGKISKNAIPNFVRE
ncbi:BRCA1 [Mytilus coruscus]|uniref:RING-type E3 ubiquitin transferase BRCA1 n=1 Tax=Mytilus coruscus TaxID=42192 RepID=A0A6J8AN78_MYTCO|nr:BRCA1 [Mytilus coruscus]